MSFGETFITLAADISDTKRDVYANARIRTMQHPLESTHSLTTRLLTYCHTYSESLQFSKELYDSKLPVLSEHDTVGTILRWIDIGLDEPRKLERSIRANPTCSHSLYFENKSQVNKFCNQLKGSKTNWIQKVDFYRWEESFVATIAEQLPTRPTWQISFVDNAVYLDTGSLELSSSIEPLNIWEHYQEVILNAPST